MNRIINFLKKHGTVFQEDYIEILYYQKDKQRLVFDVDLNKLSLIEYDDEGNIFDVNEITAKTDLTVINKIFEI